MRAQALLNELRSRGVTLRPASDGLHYVAPKGAITPELRAEIVAHKPELMRLLLCDLIELAFKPGEWVAYRDGVHLQTARYLGVSTHERVNLRLNDGAARVVAPESIALDWCPETAEVFEQRLCIMLGAGVAEDIARSRAEQCTRKYLQRLRGQQ